MAAVDPGDPILRHRGAVLDALLAEPAFGTIDSDSSPSGTSLDDIDVGAVETGAGGIREMNADMDFAAPPAPRPAPGPRASDRIMALLSGETEDAAGPLEFGSGFAGRSRRVGVDSEESDSESAGVAGESRAVRSRGSDAGPVAKLLAQLRKPKVALAVGAAVALLIVLVLVTTGSKSPSQSNQLAVVTPAPATGSEPQKSAPPEAPAATAIPVKSAKAHCPAGSTDAMDAVSGQPGKAWACVRAFKIDGQVLTLDLGQKHQVDSIAIVPGWDAIGSDGVDQWNKYRTVSKVSYEFNDSGLTTYTQQTLDQRGSVVTKISPPVTASKVTLTILESKGDPSINSTAISSIVITGQ